MGPDAVGPDGPDAVGPAGARLRGGDRCRWWWRRRSLRDRRRWRRVADRAADALVLMLRGPQAQAARVLLLRQVDHRRAIAGLVRTGQATAAEVVVELLEALLRIAGDRVPVDVRRDRLLLREHLREVRLLDLVEDAHVAARAVTDEAAGSFIAPTFCAACAAKARDSAPHICMSQMPLMLMPSNRLPNGCSRGRPRRARSRRSSRPCRTRMPTSSCP